jgi:hypothetical protein
MPNKTYLCPPKVRLSVRTPENHFSLQFANEEKFINLYKEACKYLCDHAYSDSDFDECLSLMPTWQKVEQVYGRFLMIGNNWSKHKSRYRRLYKKEDGSHIIKRGRING